MNEFLIFMVGYLQIIWIIFTVALLVAWFLALVATADTGEFGWFWGLAFGYILLVGPASWFLAIKFLGIPMEKFLFQSFLGLIPVFFIPKTCN